jgi:hypothetical protein
MLRPLPHYTQLQPEESAAHLPEHSHVAPPPEHLFTSDGRMLVEANAEVAPAAMMASASTLSTRRFIVLSFYRDFLSLSRQASDTAY